MAVKLNCSKDNAVSTERRNSVPYGHEFWHHPGSLAQLSGQIDRRSFNRRRWMAQGRVHTSSDVCVYVLVAFTRKCCNDHR